MSIGTSLPELATNINSALKGRTAIAIGNIVGSNVTNIALVAAIAIIIMGNMKFDKKLFSRDMPIMLGATVILLIFSYFFHGNINTINKIEAVVMVFCLILYLYYLMKTDHLEEEHIEEHHIKSTRYAIFLFIIGFFGIFIGSEIMIRNVIVTAKRLHISDGVIGATIVALGTSLPELSVTIIGIIKNRPNLSLGNIVGSNIFNILGVLGITGLIRDIDIINILNNKADTTTLYFALPMALIISILLFIFMRSRWRLDRYEGIILLLIYIGFIIINFIGLPYF